jgi:hypothetical protein
MSIGVHSTGTVGNQYMSSDYYNVVSMAYFCKVGLLHESPDKCVTIVDLRERDPCLIRS